MNWKAFFKDYEEYILNLDCYKCASGIALEELYQMFKQRLLEEMQNDKSIKE